MTLPDRPDPPGDAPPLSLKRWSQRKHAARREAEGVTDKRASSAAARAGAALREAPATDVGAGASPARALEADARPPKASSAGTRLAPLEPSANASASGLTVPAGADAAALPPIHSLTPESDFTRFFDAKAPVDEALKRAALKTLLRDPRFNVMDGLDTYIDDYTRSDPIPEGVLQRLVQAHSFVTPSPTSGSDPAPTPSDAALATPPASIPPPPDSPAAGAAEQDSGTSVAKSDDVPADAGKPTTT